MATPTIRSLGPTGRVSREQIRAAVKAVRAANKGKKYPLIKSAAETASGRGAITFAFMHVAGEGKPAGKSGSASKGKGTSVTVRRSRISAADG